MAKPRWICIKSGTGLLCQDVKFTGTRKTVDLTGFGDVHLIDYKCKKVGIGWECKPKKRG